MQEQNFDNLLEAITKRDPRYHRSAYLFLREALDFTQKKHSKNSKIALRHVTGQELLEGVRDYALAQFGPMTMDVFAEWGLKTGEDFGEIVFNLVENGLLSKTEKDSREDFKGGYDFYQAFREPFLPAAKKIRPPSSEPKASPS
jgi:uncharacterized repeat protein (TIGR04138 family)